MFMSCNLSDENFESASSLQAEPPDRTTSSSRFFERLFRLHAGGASGHFPALPHALELAPPVRLRLAEHVVVVEGAAAGADEVGGAEERGGGRADFLDFRDVLGHRRHVHHDMSAESVRGGGC